jgi:hypothetical protein
VRERRFFTLPLRAPAQFLPAFSMFAASLRPDSKSAACAYRGRRVDFVFVGTFLVLLLLSFALLAGCAALDHRK